MQTIHHHNFTKKLTTVIEQITEEHQPVRLELPNSIKAILLSEEDYNSMVETLYLLGNSANADRLREGILQHKLGKVKEIDVTAYLD